MRQKGSFSTKICIPNFGLITFMCLSMNFFLFSFGASDCYVNKNENLNIESKPLAVAE